MTGLDVLLWISVALAQDPLRLELSRRVPVSSADAMAMGGAGIGFANGPGGVFYTPAAAAVRKEHEGPVGVTGTLSLSSALVLSGLEPGIEADNWLQSRLDLGVGARVRRSGAALVLASLQDSGDQGELIFSEGHLVGAVQLPIGALGVGARSTWASVKREGQAPINYAGVGWQVGLLMTALDEGVNLGFSFRSRVLAPAMGESGGAPALAIAPWELTLGLGRAQISPWPRPVPLRLVVDLVLDGPVNDAAAVEGLLLSTESWVARGSHLTLAPHMGMEFEVVPERLRVRGGTWREASRIEQLSGTWHGTAGVELRLFSVKVGSWERDVAVEVSVDRGAGFTNVSWLNAGFWESGQVEGASPG